MDIAREVYKVLSGMILGSSHKGQDTPRNDINRILSASQNCEFNDVIIRTPHILAHIESIKTSVEENRKLLFSISRMILISGIMAFSDSFSTSHKIGTMDNLDSHFPSREYLIDLRESSCNNDVEHKLRTGLSQFFHSNASFMKIIYSDAKEEQQKTVHSILRSMEMGTLDTATIKISSDMEFELDGHCLTFSKLDSSLIDLFFHFTEENTKRNSLDEDLLVIHDLQVSTDSVKAFDQNGFVVLSEFIPISQQRFIFKKIIFSPTETEKFTLPLSSIGSTSSNPIPDLSHNVSQHSAKTFTDISNLELTETKDRVTITSSQWRVCNKNGVDFMLLDGLDVDYDIQNNRLLFNAKDASFHAERISFQELWSYFKGLISKNLFHSIVYGNMLREAKISSIRFVTLTNDYVVIGSNAIIFLSYEDSDCPETKLIIDMDSISGDVGIEHMSFFRDIDLIPISLIEVRISHISVCVENSFKVNTLLGFFSYRLRFDNNNNCRDSLNLMDETSSDNVQFQFRLLGDDSAIQMQDLESQTIIVECNSRLRKIMKAIDDPFNLRISNSYMALHSEGLFVDIEGLSRIFESLSRFICTPLKLSDELSSQSKVQGKGFEGMSFIFRDFFFSDSNSKFILSIEDCRGKIANGENSFSLSTTHIFEFSRRNFLDVYQRRPENSSFIEYFALFDTKKLLLADNIFLSYGKRGPKNVEISKITFFELPPVKEANIIVATLLGMNRFLEYCIKMVVIGKRSEESESMPDPLNILEGTIQYPSVYPSTETDSNQFTLPSSIQVPIFNSPERSSEITSPLPIEENFFDELKEDYLKRSFSKWSHKLNLKCDSIRFFLGSTDSLKTSLSKVVINYWKKSSRENAIHIEMAHYMMKDANNRFILSPKPTIILPAVYVLLKRLPDGPFSGEIRVEPLKLQTFSKGVLQEQIAKWNIPEKLMKIPVENLHIQKTELIIHEQVDHVGAGTTKEIEFQCVRYPKGTLGEAIKSGMAKSFSTSFLVNLLSHDSLIRIAQSFLQLVESLPDRDSDLAAHPYHRLPMGVGHTLCTIIEETFINAARLFSTGANRDRETPSSFRNSVQQIAENLKKCYENEHVSKETMRETLANFFLGLGASFSVNQGVNS